MRKAEGKALDEPCVVGSRVYGAGGVGMPTSSFEGACPSSKGHIHGSAYGTYSATKGGQHVIQVDECEI